ncbi:MAG: hypothetical protein QXU82_02045 [Candidatus Aenigmatarchaeota archaeon]
MVLHKIFKKKKKAFGGYCVNFTKVKHMTLGQVFGTKDMGPSEMTKKLWKVVKGHHLACKK